MKYLPLLIATTLSPLAHGQRAATFQERLAAEDAAIDAAFETRSSDSFLDRFTFGSYGELHYNSGESSLDEELDLHRLVLFTAFEFTKKARFISEIEIEHLIRNRDGNEVEYELEQAFFEFDLENNYTLTAGGFLVPVGIINEIHEPTTFYGVERNSIETQIIPSTWTEFGVGITKKYNNGLQWDLYAHRGLYLDSSAFNDRGNGPRIRSGRQKAGSFENLFSAATARVKYTGISGLEVSGSIQYQDDISEGSEDNSAVLTSAHFIYNNGGFGLRGLAAHWNIDGDDSSGNSIRNQFGGYIEPSYKWTFDNGMAVGIFGRALYYENGRAADGLTEYATGINFWPTENLVLKADYIHEDRTGGSDDRDRFNLGIGYSF